MGINITHTLNNSEFQNREELRNAARQLLSRKTNSKESIERIIDKTIFNAATGYYYNPQLNALKAATQNSLHRSFKETLKYAKNKSNKVKEPKFGEIWNLFTQENTTLEYTIEDFEPDFSAENIFAAA